MSRRKNEMRGSDLGIIGIILLGAMALVLAFATIVVSKDPEVIKAALGIAGVTAAAVSGLVGYIGVYHVGKNDGNNVAPEKPIVT